MPSLVFQAIPSCLTPLTVDFLEQPPDQAKSIVAQALQKIPLSVKLWIKAMDLEADMKSKKRVIRKALEELPNSVRA
jgi:hypothetical protein